jgi:predicted DNA-binding WGR domain protein
MIDYKFIGWCSDPIENHDKVWAVIIIKNNYSDLKVATIWGRRGKTLQSKIIETTEWDLKKLIKQKINKGYTMYSKSELDQVYPNFEADLEMTSTWALLKA